MDQSLRFNLLTAFHFPLLLCTSVLIGTYNTKVGKRGSPLFLVGGHFVCEMSLSHTEHLVA